MNSFSGSQTIIIVPRKFFSTGLEECGDPDREGANSNLQNIGQLEADPCPSLVLSLSQSKALRAVTINELLSHIWAVLRSLPAAP